jgi:CubicO group peptidase (beta-lactamase class C family)
MTTTYTPEAKGDWERSAPEEVGFRVEGLRVAVEHAEAHEIPWPRDVGRVLTRFEKPPYDEVLGPTRERGGPAGLVIRRGRIAAAWGDPARADMTFSATKSYLATLAGLAWDRGLIGDLADPVRNSVDDGGFDSPHNSSITWHHLLQQTSEWEGTLFGIPDTVDRNRSVGAEGGAEKGTHRELRAPGQWWEYNDVRVNRLGLALLRVWGEPLPGVLKREVMDAIGASDTWEWHGYRTSWVDVNGTRMQSVPGGAHWGGGLWISSFDHARFGLLFLRRGGWAGRQILSREWVGRMTTPCPKNRSYGYMWWLNSDRTLLPAASESAFAAQGAGGNTIAVDPESDLVIVTRWCADVPGVIERVIAALDR